MWGAPPHHTDAQSLKKLHLSFAGCGDEEHHDINTPTALREHFAPFGDVVDVLCLPAKYCADVEFASHEMAARAKSQGKVRLYL